MQMAIVGICGKMGNQIYEFYKNEFNIVGFDVISHLKAPTYSSLKEYGEPIDVLVDFSSCDSFSILKEAIIRGIPVLSGTTGYEDEKITELKKLAEKKGSVFIWKANYAKGIRLFTRMIKDCKKEFEVLDFVEIHATTKKDAPSGTAKVLARELLIPYEKIQSLRINMAPAIHEIIFSSENERVILRHEIMNKKAFVLGFDEELRKVLGVGKDVEEVV